MAEQTRNLTQEQTERADQLHASALVVNCYGGPFSAARSIRMWRAGRLRDDGEWVPPVDDAVKSRLVPEMRAGGVDCDIASIASLAEIALWLREFQTSGSEIALALTGEDVRRARARGQVSFILTASSAGITGVESDLDALLLYHRGGIRMWSLTHSARNIISDGCGEETGAGLSRFGRAFVRELNRQKFLIDVSHISDAGFWDVLELSDSPIIATHSNCRAVCDHPRNITDEMITALTAKGGVVSLNFFPSFVKSAEPTVEDLIAHIDHISELVGPQYVGLGPDFCDGRWDFVLASWWSRNSSDHNAKRQPIDYPRGIEDISKMPNVTRALVARGYSDQEIVGILGGNFLRVFDSVVI